jgi:hypothetical protein
MQASASFSARNSPGRLTISAARTNMVRRIRRTVRPQRIPSEGACLGALGAGGCNRLRLRVFRACGLASAGISFFLATKDYSDRPLVCLLTHQLSLSF